MDIQPVDDLPPLPPVEGPTVKHFVGRLMRVRMKLTAAADGPVAVRPYYAADGEWWPLRADGSDGVGTEPVTAIAGKYDKKADGFYVTGGLANHVCFLTETGQASDVEKLLVDASDMP